MTAQIIAIAIIIVLLIAIAQIISYTNKAVILEEYVYNSYFNIKIAIQNRGKLINSLIDAAKAYLEHENKTFTEVANIDALFAKYPELRGVSIISNLMADIKSAEASIVATKAIYNNTVTNYNICTKTFPGCIFCMATKKIFQRCGEN